VSGESAGTVKLAVHLGQRIGFPAASGVALFRTVEQAGQGIVVRDMGRPSGAGLTTEKPFNFST
jgi:hypothetical protein